DVRTAPSGAPRISAKPDTPDPLHNPTLVCGRAAVDKKISNEAVPSDTGVIPISANLSRASNKVLSSTRRYSANAQLACLPVCCGLSAFIYLSTPVGCRCMRCTPHCKCSKWLYRIHAE